MFSFDQSNNTGAIDVKMDRSIFEEKPCFKMLRLNFSSKLKWGFYIISIAKNASKKIGVLIRSMNFLSPEVALYLHQSTMRPCMKDCCLFGLVLLVATWNFWIIYRNGYTGLLVLSLLPLLNH